MTSLMVLPPSTAAALSAFSVPQDTAARSQAVSWLGLT
jgi:hypothetical protein